MEIEEAFTRALNEPFTKWKWEGERMIPLYTTSVGEELSRVIDDFPCVTVYCNDVRPRSEDFDPTTHPNSTHFCFDKGFYYLPRLNVTVCYLYGDMYAVVSKRKAISE